jgi:putative phage-type endonuclease
VPVVRGAERRHSDALLQVRAGAAMTVAIRQNTPEWLAARKATIGSSDIPIIVGESTYKSAHTLAAEKLGLVEAVVDASTQELFDIGHIMQPALLAIYELRTGRKVRAVKGWRVHKQIAWATASLDGEAPVRRAVEAKWTNAARWRSGERVPGDVQAQAQWQMFVLGWDVVDVVAMTGGVPRIEEVGRDEAMIDNLLYFAREFYGYLERGELPPVDGSDSTRQTLRARFPRDDGPILPATAELAEMVTGLAEARAQKKAAENAEGTYANALLAVLGEAAGIEGLVAFKKNRDSTSVNWPAIAGAYRTLLIEGGRRPEELDTLQSIHTDTVEGKRPLRLLSKGNAE